MLITSPQNPRVKSAAKLRTARGRAQADRIIIDGVREIGRALDAGIQLVEIYVCDELCRDDESRQLLKRLSSAGAERLDVTPAVFQKIAFGERAEGIVAIAETPRRKLDDLKLPPTPLVALVEGVEKPGNLGAVIRSADGAGVSAVIVVDGGSDLYNPNAIRASLGTIFLLPVCQSTSEETLGWLRKRGIAVLAARVDGSVDYTSCDFTGPCAVVLGSEAAGLSGAWGGNNVTAIRLPMRGAADSLNVSATAAVLFYEALRQRSQV